MTINAQITAATQFFTALDGPGEAMVLYPEGVYANAVEFNGVLDRDNLAGIGAEQTFGDGRLLNDENGRRERWPAVIEMPIAIFNQLQRQQSTTRPDIILASGVYWAVKKAMGSDHAMGAVACVNAKTAVEQRGRSRTG